MAGNSGLSVYELPHRTVGSQERGPHLHVHPRRVAYRKAERTQMPDEDQEHEEQTLSTLDEVREALKRERQRRAELETQLPDANALRKENLMLRAGIDTESPLGELFSKAYEGELDIEAVRGQWEKIAPQPRGAEPPPEELPRTPSPEDHQLDDQRAGAAAAQHLHAESTQPGQEPEKPIGLAMMDAAFAAQGGVRARPAGGMSDRSAAAAFDVLFERAAKGDPQAVFKSPEESWQAAKERYDRR